MKILVTGGAGFIGGALVRYLIDKTDHELLNIDKLTYAGNLTSLASVKGNKRYQFARIDICDHQALAKMFDQFKPDAVMHLAAESHVDRSIAGAEAFIETNIIGTYRLLEQSRHYWQTLSPEKKAGFRFHHISTDEVYGDLDENKENRFLESTPYAPSSPYSASKASSDHLVRAWHRTYGLPVLVTNCSNNYGPYQFPEKLIPLVILNALNQKPITIYGSGLQIRDWLYVEDHVEALYQVLTKGKIGETYNIGGNNEKTNLEVVQTILSLLEKMRPNKPEGLTSYQDLMTHTKDRPGHDKRYAINCEKIKKELGFEPKTCFEDGLEKTIHWYLNNQAWIQSTETKESDLVLS